LPKFVVALFRPYFDFVELTCQNQLRSNTSIGLQRLWNQNSSGRIECQLGCASHKLADKLAAFSFKLIKSTKLFHNTVPFGTRINNQMSFQTSVYNKPFTLNIRHLPFERSR